MHLSAKIIHSRHLQHSRGEGVCRWDHKKIYMHYLITCPLLFFQEESVQTHWNEPSQGVHIQPDFCSHVLSLYCIISQLISRNLLGAPKDDHNYSHPRIIVVGNPALLRRSLLSRNLEGSNWKKSFKTRQSIF